MQPVQSTNVVPVAIPVAKPGTSEQPKEPLVGGGVQGAIGDLLRNTAAGYATATAQEAVQSDRASIYPFEAVVTATGLLKSKTANIKGVNKATSLLHTIGGFGMLVISANLSGTLRAPGSTAQDFASHVADAIDGKATAQGWSLGWGVRTPAGSDAGAARSDIGSALAQAGMR